MNYKIMIDGFEFDREYSDVSDIENLNYFLDKKFNQFDVKDYMARLHPELFPSHIGLQCDENLNLDVVRWKRGGLDPWGEYDNGWKCYGEKEPEKYLDDILSFYKDNDTLFYNFIKKHICSDI